MEYYIEVDVEKVYRKFGGDYEGVMARIGNPMLLARLFEKFMEDKSFESLKTALAGGDCESAFRAAHTLKGVALNMGFSKLAASSSKLTELLRKGTLDGSGELLEPVERDYQAIVDAIGDEK